MRKLTDKQEAYCQHIAKVKGRVKPQHKIDAVIYAGFSSKTLKSQKAKVDSFSKNKSIKNRISDLRGSPGGCPTKYKQEHCEMVVKFFTREPYKPIMVKDDKNNDVIGTDKSGRPLFTPCALPTKEAFATSINVDRTTLINWANKHDEFFNAIKKAEDLQKDILIQNGLIGNYDKTFAIFVAKNVTDMNDKQVIEQKTFTAEIPADASPEDAARIYNDLMNS